MENKIKEIIAEQFNKDLSEIKMETNFIEDLKADSLELTDLIMTLEDEFEIEIPEEEVEKIKTVKDVVDYIGKNK